MTLLGNERRVLRTAPLALLVAAFAGCAKPQPPEFVSKDDKFRAQFAGAPKVVERSVGGKRSVVYSIETADGASTVAVMESPLKDDAPAEEVPRFLEWARDNLIRGAGGKLASDTSTTLAGKYPGRNFTAGVAEPVPGVLRARVFLVGKRLYQVMVMGTDGYANSQAATAFLDSFQLTE